MFDLTPSALAARVRRAYPKLNFRPYRAPMRAMLIRDLMRADEAFQAIDPEGEREVLLAVAEALLAEDGP